MLGGLPPVFPASSLSENEIQPSLYSATLASSLPPMYYYYVLLCLMSVLPTTMVVEPSEVCMFYAYRCLDP
jgi:hypothetical protein